MTSPRRQTKWYNELNEETVIASDQSQFVIATTGFDKGETVVRILLALSTRQVTQGVPQNIGCAVWVGNFGGIPSNIFADSSEGYMMWTAWEQQLIGSGGAAVRYQSWDLRGQRAARSDTDQIHFVMATGASSSVRFVLSSRVLVLLP